jgi:hypothetical protein
LNHFILFALAIFGLLVSSFVPSTTTGDAKENNLINELIKTGKFTEDEAKEFVTKPMQNEQEDNNNQTKTTPPIASGNSGDTFNINVILLKGKPSPITFEDDSEDESVWYELPDKGDYQFDVSNSSIVCPSNQCKIMSYADKMLFITMDNGMALAGNFKLIDDKSNGHLNPKKQQLIEQMNFDFNCNYQDIQEDLAKKTTKYICSDPQDGSIRRNFNDTTYPYTFTATFELPSRHLVLNATEAHNNPYLLFSGHLVFKTEDGNIVVK